MREKRVADSGRHVAKRTNAWVIGNRQRRWSGEHERRLPAGFDVLLEIFDERGASLVAIDAPEIQDEIPRDAKSVEHIARRMRIALRLEADADHARGLQPSSSARRDERLLLRRQKEVA